MLKQLFHFIDINIQIIKDIPQVIWIGKLFEILQIKFVYLRIG